MTAAEQDADFAAGLPAFVSAIKQLFAPGEIRAYLDHLERAKLLAPSEPEIEMEDEEGEVDDAPWPANPCWARRNCYASLVSDNYFSASDAEKNMPKPDGVLFPQDRVLKPVLPGQKVPLKLSARERELILEHTFADDELTAPLHVVPTSDEAAVYAFTLDDLEELAGYVAAEANQG